MVEACLVGSKPPSPTPEGDKQLSGRSTATRVPVTVEKPATSTIIPATQTPPLPSDTPTRVYMPITWMELVDFLAKDHTNWNEYVSGDYACLDFSVDLVANAEAQGLKAWIVLAEFTQGGPGHAFVAFETTDLGIVYVEPQADDTYPVVEVGQPLCDSWGVFECMGTVSSLQFAQCNHETECIWYTP